MGFLYPSEKEQNLYSDMLLEAGKLMGTRVTIKLVAEPNLDIYHDPNYEFKNPMQLDIILDEHPQIKVLRHLHWYNENDEVLPILAYISKRDYKDLDMDILMGATVELPYLLSGVAGTKSYTIMDARAYGPGPMFWVCKLAPIRSDFEQIMDEDRDNNFEYLNVPKS